MWLKGESFWASGRRYDSNFKLMLVGETQRTINCVCSALTNAVFLKIVLIGGDKKYSTRDVAGKISYGWCKKFMRSDETLRFPDENLSSFQVTL